MLLKLLFWPGKIWFQYSRKGGSNSRRMMSWFSAVIEHATRVSANAAHLAKSWRLVKNFRAKWCWENNRVGGELRRYDDTVLCVAWIHKVCTYSAVSKIREKIQLRRTSYFRSFVWAFSDFYKAFIRNKTTFTKYCLTQWIPKLPGSFEIHWVRQYLVNFTGLVGTI